MVELSLKNERYRRSETLSGSGKQECIYPLFSRRTKKSAVTLIDTAFQPTQFLAGLAGGAAPSGAVPSGGLFVTGTVTVPVTVSVTVTVRFVRVCSHLFVFVQQKEHLFVLFVFVRFCFVWIHRFFYQLLTAFS